MEKVEEIILTITLGNMESKPHIYGLNTKIKNALKNGFRFSETVKLTVKYYSRLSNKKECTY